MLSRRHYWKRKLNVIAWLVIGSAVAWITAAIAFLNMGSIDYVLAAYFTLSAFALYGTRSEKVLRCRLLAGIPVSGFLGAMIAPIGWGRHRPISVYLWRGFEPGYFAPVNYALTGAFAFCVFVVIASDISD